MNTSATGGYLTPTDPPAPLLEGEALEDFFHDVIVGVSGLPNEMVRPAWQGEPPNVPQYGKIWIAFHFVDQDSDAFPFVGQVVAADASVQQSELQRHEEFDVHCSVYGSGAGSEARAVAKLIRDNLSVPQNQESFYNAGMGLINVTAPQPAPVLTKERWLYRVDADIRMRRIVVRDYPVLTIESAQYEQEVQLNSDKFDTTITVENT